MALQEDAALASELHVRSWWIVSSMAKQHINVLVVEDEKLLN
jgi:hypothetical protein